MAFIRTDFGIDSSSMNSNAPRQWSYVSNDAKAVIDTSGYFNDASDLLKVGDVINTVADKDGTPSYGMFLVNSNTGGVVDVADQDTWATTDTD